MLQNLKSSKGMTLMEILIVIAIIGFLASILYPQIQSARIRAQIKQTKISIGQVVQALNNYNIDCNKYPSSSLSTIIPRLFNTARSSFISPTLFLTVS